MSQFFSVARPNAVIYIYIYIYINKTASDNCSSFPLKKVYEYCASKGLGWWTSLIFLPSSAYWNWALFLIFWALIFKKSLSHTYIYTLSLPTRLCELLYSLKRHFTEYPQRLAETRPNITTLCKRFKLLSTFQRELRTLLETLILLYNCSLCWWQPDRIPDLMWLNIIHPVYSFMKDSLSKKELWL